jgi:hypothetical protein
MAKQRFSLLTSPWKDRSRLVGQGRYAARLVFLRSTASGPAAMRFNRDIPSDMTAGRKRPFVRDA